MGPPPGQLGPSQATQEEVSMQCAHVMCVFVAFSQSRDSPFNSLVGELDASLYGLSLEDSTLYDTHGIVRLPDGITSATLAQITNHLYYTYCKNLGAEFTHLHVCEVHMYTVTTATDRAPAPAAPAVCAACAVTVAAAASANSAATDDDTADTTAATDDDTAAIATSTSTESV